MTPEIKNALIRALGDSKMSALMIGYCDGTGGVRTFTAGMSEEVRAIVFAFNEDMKSVNQKVRK